MSIRGLHEKALDFPKSTASDLTIAEHDHDGLRWTGQLIKPLLVLFSFCFFLLSLILHIHRASSRRRDALTAGRSCGVLSQKKDPKRSHINHTAMSLVAVESEALLSSTELRKPTQLAGSASFDVPCSLPQATSGFCCKARKGHRGVNHQDFVYPNRLVARDAKTLISNFGTRCTWLKLGNQ